MARVLVVDDDSSVRLAMRYVLEADGHEVAEAGGGEAAEHAHAARPADVIVLDMHMPRRDGIETLMALRRVGAAPKVIMVGGDCRLCRTDFLPMVRTLGAHATLQKPLVADLLRRVVADMLKQPRPPAAVPAACAHGSE